MENNLGSNTGDSEIDEELSGSDYGSSDLDIPEVIEDGDEELEKEDKTTNNKKYTENAGTDGALIYPTLDSEDHSSASECESIGSDHKKDTKRVYARGTQAFGIQTDQNLNTNGSPEADDASPNEAPIKCPICMGGIRQPIATSCGHMMCFECLQEMDGNVPVTRRKCPVCRATLDFSKDLTPIFLTGLQCGWDNPESEQAIQFMAKFKEFKEDVEKKKKRRNAVRRFGLNQFGNGFVVGGRNGGFQIQLHGGQIGPLAIPLVMMTGQGIAMFYRALRNHRGGRAGNNQEMDERRVVVIARTVVFVLVFFILTILPTLEYHHIFRR